MNLLSIGGSDPSSGSGIQGDIRAAASMGAYCMGAVSAITVQGTSGFWGVEPVRPGTVARQVRAVLDDFEVGAVKVGMVCAGAPEAIRGALEGVGAPVVLDPAVTSTTGGELMPPGVVAEYARHLVPIAAAVTPNAGEAAALSGMPGAAPAEAARAILGMGAGAVVVTGAASDGATVSDLAVWGGSERLVPGPRAGGANRGSGGFHSVVLALALGGGLGVEEAAVRARSESLRAVSNSGAVGSGLPVVGAGAAGAAGSLLAGGIEALGRLEGVHRLIPECQTNFVCADGVPGSAADVVGIRGRIVRTGRQITVAGGLEYGGSKHVATALVAMCSKFPGARSAINVRYSEGVVGRIRGAGMSAVPYDRGSEPAGAGSSVGWGTTEAARGTDVMPDAVFHTGAHGKEPMVIIFGTSPADVVEKVSRIL